ncbi:TIGR02391 family protein, partial [Saccharopolyspora sp. NPDC050389]|uniref:TIGR02391 family protein n=1 Tax=Saccharopolyspora sp. NPDC050389 TaxID=3155516 RepID=UPI0033DABA74
MGSGGPGLKLNAETQNKSQRRDISEAPLFTDVFSEAPPKPDKPRLRVHPDDRSKTFSSMHRGVRSFAEGCYAAIRNPSSHESKMTCPNTKLSLAGVVRCAGRAQRQVALRREDQHQQARRQVEVA